MSRDDRPSAQRFYDRISRAYDLIADAGEHKARERGLELLAPAPGERALEIGYGTGHSLEALAAAVGAAGRVVGVDLLQGRYGERTDMGALFRPWRYAAMLLVALGVLYHQIRDRL